MGVTTPSPLARALPWPGWRHLPREARDTLFLLAVIGWTVLPHLSHLPPWCTVLTAAVLLWRARLALANAPLPGRWVLVGVLLLAAGLTFWSHRSLLGKEPGVTMAIALMALKTLELRARRDAFVVFFLGFFLILTHFLYSQSLPVALAMLVSVWGLLTALVLAHMPAGRPSLRRAALLAGRTALLGAPVMALLFLLFPRVGPLWGVPQDGRAGTGLSNSLTMGSVAELALDDSVAMRLRFDGAPPPPEAAYFRGPVLAAFDGREWKPLAPSFPRALLPRAELRVRGSPIRYEVTLEPLRIASVPLLEATLDAPLIDGRRLQSRDDLQWLSERPLAERVRFTAQAYTDFRHGPTEMMVGLQDYLDLPPGYNPRTLEWAAALRRQPRYAQADGRTLAQAVLGTIRSGGFSYTLTPGLYGEADTRSAIDEFWLDRRLGFCEHFAAAFVVVMRALDVPARIVTGYQGMDALTVDGWHIVRQSHAHAWAEYWQPGVGWVRADPTAAVAPDRILRGASLASPPGLMAGALGSVDPRLATQLRNLWEAVDNRWNQWVLSYSRGRQLDLLRQLGVSAPGWEDLALLLVGALSALALAGAGRAWLDRHRAEPWARQMERLRRSLAMLGMAVAAHEPPRTLAARVRAELGAPSHSGRGDGAPAGTGAPLALAALLDQLDAQRYGRDALSRPDTALTRQFTALARHCRGAAGRRGGPPPGRLREAGRSPG